MVKRIQFLEIQVRSRSFREILEGEAGLISDVASMVTFLVVLCST